MEEESQGGEFDNDGQLGFSLTQPCFMQQGSGEGGSSRGGGGGGSGSGSDSARGGGGGSLSPDGTASYSDGGDGGCTQGFTEDGGGGDGGGGDGGGGGGGGKSRGTEQEVWTPTTLPPLRATAKHTDHPPRQPIPPPLSLPEDGP
jgi:hypothetical protein